MRSRLWLAGKWISIAISAAATTTVAVKCATGPPQFPPGGGRWDHNWDLRESYKTLKPPQPFSKDKGESVKNSEDTTVLQKSTHTRRIFLIRHGQYHMDVKDSCDKKLTELGKEQAKFTGERLKKFGVIFDCLVTSTLPRAIQTTEIILDTLKQDGLTIREKDLLLSEGSPVLPEPNVSSWRPPYQYDIDGTRIEAAFRKYIHRADPTQECDSNEIIVCHANVIRYFVCRALQLPPEAWLRISLKNGSITCLEIQPSGRVKLVGLGVSGHLPVSHITTS